VSSTLQGLVSIQSSPLIILRKLRFGSSTLLEQRWKSKFGLSLDDELLGTGGGTDYIVAWEEKSSIPHQKKVQSSETQ